MGPYLKDRFFLDEVFNSSTRSALATTCETVVGNFGKSSSAARCGHLRIFHSRNCVRSWIVKFYIFLCKFYGVYGRRITRYNSFLVTSNNIEYDEYDFCQKIIHFWTWTISIDFFFFLHTLFQLSIYLPAKKIGLRVIILPGYKVK